MRWCFAVVLVVCASAACSDGVLFGPDVRPSAQTGLLEALVLDMLAPPDPDPLPPTNACATPSIARWTGTARRANDFHYPDTLEVTVTWTKTSSVGCVDTFAPSGALTYHYAVPGALCVQKIEPTTAAISGSDGTLTIDRSASPATFNGRAVTLYPMTWSCRRDDGTTTTQSLQGGGTWFEARGNVSGGSIAGTEAGIYDSPRCGPNGATPCTYTWSFNAAE